jgi:drug/metabolite transporter (DMT)-like permease
MRRFIGILCVLAAGISFGFMPLFKRWVVEADPTVSTAMLLMLRFGLASAILLPLIAARKLPMPKGRILLGYVAMGCIGYFGEAYCFFGALNHIPGGLVSLLLYTYPAFVTLGAWALFGERPSAWTLASLGVASAGMAMTIVPTLAETSETLPGANRLLGVALGLGTALIYGAYVLAGTALSRRFEGPLQSSFIVMSSAAAVFAGIVLWHREPLPTSAGVWAAAASLAVVGSVIAITALLAGLAILGPVKTSALSLVEPLATVLIGAAFLHERLTPVQLAGGGLILLGAALSIRRSGGSSEAPDRAN